MKVLAYRVQNLGKDTTLNEVVVFLVVVGTIDEGIRLTGMAMHIHKAYKVVTILSRQFFA